MTLRCLIVDDNRRFLKAASDLLEQEGINVVGAASTSADALRGIDELRPDVALVDIELGSESGFDLVPLVVSGTGGSTRVIVISNHAERDFLELIEASGAIGFLPKSALSAKEIRAVLAGARDDGANAPPER